MPKTFFIILILIGLTIPFFVWAGILSGPIVPCGRDTNGNGILDQSEHCTLCDIFKMLQTIITFIGAAIFVIATIFVGVGGIIMLTSGGSPDKVGQGKAMITNAVIGIIIALLSWVIINEVLIAVSGSMPGERVGKIFDWPWNQIQCVGGGITEGRGQTGSNICCCDLSDPNNPYTCSTYPDNAQCYSDCQIHCQGFSGYLRWCCIDIQRACGGGTADRCNRMSSPGYCFSNNYYCLEGVLDQVSDATSELVSLLSCMANSLPSGNARDISSISDNSGGRCFSNWNGQCPSGTDSCGGTCCGHEQYSLHYGGSGCRGFSYAIDFATESAYTYIHSAATSCGTSLGLGQIDVIYEGDHVHVELDGLARQRYCI